MSDVLCVDYETKTMHSFEMTFERPADLQLFLQDGTTFEDGKDFFNADPVNSVEEAFKVALHHFKTMVGVKVKLEIDEDTLFTFTKVKVSGLT